MSNLSSKKMYAESVFVTPYDEDSDLVITLNDMFCHITIEGSHMMIDTDKIDLVVGALKSAKDLLEE